MIVSATRVAAGVAGAALAVVAVLSGSAVAQAAPVTSRIDPAAVTEIVVHKFEQPVEAGTAASGLPLDTTGLTPVAGAAFTANRVPGIDLTTAAGQQSAAAMTPAEAAALIAGAAPDAEGTTGADGVTVLAPLGVGLYYVEETVTPHGYVGAAPFLVALPMTHPMDRDGWLTTVHVYPKNAPAHVVLDVIDADAVALGDAVRWISRSDIPRVPSIDGYRVVQKLDPNLELVDGGEHIRVSIDAPGAPELVAGTDYVLTVSDDPRTVTVDFTDAGRAVLAAHAGAQVIIDYRTTVLGEGDLVATAQLYPSRATIDAAPGAPGPVEASNRTKWGPLAVLVHENGNPANPIPGACFMLYTSEADALAQRNPITVDGVSQWRTDSAGRFVVDGLRYSGFVDGFDREQTDPAYRLYWVVPTCVPSGWQWVDERPLAGAVDSSVEFQTLVFVVQKAAGLALTGAQVAGAALLAAVLLGGGLLLLARRRDREGEPQVAA